jgi:excisionase family DNA binding protein
MTLIDTEVAARALGVTARTIRRWVASGVLPDHGDGRNIRISIDDVLGVSDARLGDVR